MSYCFDAHARTMATNREMINKLSSLVREYILNDSCKLKYLNEIKTSLEESVKNEHLVKEAKQIVTKLNGNNNEDENDLSYDEAFSEYQNIVKSFESESTLRRIYKENKNLNQLERLITDIKGSDDAECSSPLDEDGGDDIVATQNEISLVDPISKSLMKQPVRHMICGHVYEKESILHLLKRKNKGCPQMGCSHRKPIQKDDLEPALDYMREIDRRKRMGTYKL